LNKIINLRDAQVSTATIEIRTLTVSNKQVTLAVFRQLVEEQLIAPEGKLNGIPWGVVNYHPDKCADYPAHIHVVWQRENELRRSRVYLEPFRDKSFFVDEIDTASALAARDFLMGREKALNWHFDDTPVKIRPAKTNRIIGDYEEKYGHFETSLTDEQRKDLEDNNAKVVASFGGHADYMALHKAGYRYEHEYKPKHESFFAGTHAININEFIDAVNQINPKTLQQYFPVLIAATKAEMNRRARWESVTSNLQTLPQLFIAV